MNGNNKSPHILGASSNLIGFSFLLLTAIQLLRIPANTVIDEIAAIEVFIFSISTFFSFLSIRAKTERNNVVYENIADAVFLVGLLILVVTGFFLVFKIVA